MEAEGVIREGLAFHDFLIYVVISFGQIILKGEMHMARKSLELETSDGQLTSAGEMILDIAIHQPNVQVPDLVSGARVDVEVAAALLWQYARKLDDCGRQLCRLRDAKTRPHSSCPDSY